MKKLLTLIFVTAIVTLYLMNCKVQGGEHPKAEAPKADSSKEEHPKAEESEEEHPKQKSNCLNTAKE